ncbi:543_t:CDS:2 [Dentiscutata erythropus]|uniref:543_t:CDS:1 n=1 Tax=Dentiscutata erythropus TaxID=1348616 RepID=A0A9N9IG51_9GLOM|nr:543_t:CDS:2 [Dentiscutata erythropus]
MKGKFGLDIAHYVSLPSFAEDALYKTTGQEIELFTDDNMYLFCEKGIRGGISMITPDETPDLFNKITKWDIPDNAEKGYILEVDLDYPYNLHKAHTSYPLAPENINISKEEMSKCGQEVINNLKHYTKTKKLVPNLNNKKNDYKPEHPIYEALGKEKIILNKKVLGKFKDESCDTAMWKFCRPRPKLYSYILANEKTDRRAKGVQKVVVKKNFTHNMYKDCLKSRKEYMVTMHRLGSKDHIIRLLHSS